MVVVVVFWGGVVQTATVSDDRATVDGAGRGLGWGWECFGSAPERDETGVSVSVSVSVCGPGVGVGVGGGGGKKRCGWEVLGSTRTSRRQMHV